MSRKPQSPSSNLMDSQNDTSKVLSMTEVAENARENMFKTEIVRLEKHNIGLAQTIDQLMKSLEAKDDEITHLKKVLVGGHSIIGEVSKIIVSDEEAIIDIQIRKLKEETQFRSMTLDEAKRFDIYLKNKREMQKVSPPKEREAGLPKDTSPAKLLEIASTRIKTQE